MVCYVGFWVWFPCAWNEVWDRVVDWLPADVACPAPPAYVLPHAVLHGAVAVAHVITYLFQRYARCMKLFGRRKEVLPSRMARVAIPVRQEVIGESRFQGEIERFKLTHGRKAFAVLWLSTDPVNALSPVQVMLASGDDFVTCGWLPEPEASSWEVLIRSAASQGDALYCDAEIRGGWEKAPSYGVWLTPERI